MPRPAAAQLILSIVAAVALLTAVPASADSHLSLVIATSDGDIDATAVFDELVDRYRGLAIYRDITVAEYVTTRQGEAPNLVVSRFRCHVEADDLRVDNAGTQVRGGLGIDVPLARSAAVEALVRRYNLWLAPHMTLKFSKEPLSDFRLGVPAGFAADEATIVESDGTEFLRLTLLERAPETESRADLARFILFVNAETGLVERIEGEQVLPDGARYSTTLRITPVEVRQAPVN